MENTEEKELVVLKPFDIQKAKLQELAEEYKNLVVSDETYENARKVRAIFREKRLEIQNILKENKSLLNSMKSKQEEMAQELIAIISPVEDQIDAGMKVIDQRKEQEKKRKEEEAMKKISDRQSLLSGYEMKYDNGSYILGDHSISAVQIKVFSDEEFDEFLGKVKEEHQKIIDLRKQAEEERKKKEAELEQQRIEQAAEAKRLQELRIENEKREADLKEEQARIQREADEKAALERKKLEEEQDKLRKEQEDFLRQKRDTRIYQLKDIGLSRNTISTGYVFEDVFVSDDAIDSLDAKLWTEIVSDVKIKVSGIKEVKLLKEKEEQDRKEAERKDAEEKAKLRAEQLRPDREKIAAYMSSVMRIEVPELSDHNAKMLMGDILEMLKGIETFVESKINNL